MVPHKPGPLAKRLRLLHQSTVAANEMIAAAKASIELHLTFRTGQRDRLEILRLLVACRKCGAPPAGIPFPESLIPQTMRSYRTTWGARLGAHSGAVMEEPKLK